MENMQMLMWAWTVTTPINAIFGVVVYAMAHAARFGADGNTCAENQPARAKVLVAMIIFFYVTYICAAIFVFTFPMVGNELAICSWRRREAERKAEAAEKKAEEKARIAADRKVMGLPDAPDSEPEDK